MIANGVVFAYGSGEGTDQAVPALGLTNTIAERIPASTHATLYALDARTGKELWSSGDQIKSWNHWSGLSVANGRVYLSTSDEIYCIGRKDAALLDELDALVQAERTRLRMADE